MTLKVSVALRNALLQGSSVKEQLDNGFLYVFAGAEPADADVALDMVGTHTLLAKIAADAVPADAGVVGLQFAASAANGALAKSGAQTWAGKIHFVGKDAAQAGVGALTAVFFRFAAAGDNAQAAGTTSTPRLQGSINTAGADWNMTSTALFDNGTNTVGVGSAEVRQPIS
jgi:hypothetical protein